MADRNEPPVEPMEELSEIDMTTSVYLDFARGDLDLALRAAVSDLLEVSSRATFQQRALDRWVSRGYVQGRAMTERKR